MNKYYCIGYISLFVLLLAGCASEKDSSDIVELKPVSLTKDLTISADNADVMIGDPEGVSSDGSGNIYIADTKLQKVHFFSPEGKYQASIGREGKGPGEFDNLNPSIEIKSDTLYVLQNNAREIDLFDLNLNQHVRTLKIPDVKLGNRSIGKPSRIFPLENGNILVSFTDPYFRAPKEDDEPQYITVSKIDPLGNFVDRNLVQLPVPFPTDQRLVYLESNSVYVYTAEFYPDVLMDSDRDGNLYIGKSDSLYFKQYNQHGELIGEPKGISSRISFTSSDLDSLSRDLEWSKFKKAVNETGQPDYWPSFQSFVVDDLGRCWIKQLNPGNKYQVWQILDSDGEPQWEFELPSEVDLFEIKQGQAYGIQQSAEGLSSIIRYNYKL